MTSLRFRFILLLVLSIFGVVALASLAAISVMRPPQHDSFMEPIAENIQLLTKLALAGDTGTAETAQHFDIRSAPDDSPIDTHGTHFLGSEAHKIGFDNRVIVTIPPNKPWMLASVEMRPQQWLVIHIPNIIPPHDGRYILTGWLFLILLGACAVSVYFARALLRPLAMLEQAASSVGSGGLLAPIPERGTGEVVATARALNHLSQRLKSEMESRMRLVAAAGHDLRTPLTRMRLRAEFIQEEEDRAKWLSDLDELESIAESAIRLVREEVTQEPPEPTDLGTLLAELVAEMRDLSLPASLGRIADIEVRAARFGLRRALRNLIANAATHGGGAEVALERQEDEAVITISDHGPGIPEPLLAKAFEPFFRVDPARRKAQPGAGLGLAIAREIVERSGGRIFLSNRPGGGLLQVIRLPLRD